MKNVPEKIYLQVDADGETPDEFNELAVSWCSNKVNDNDIEYLLTNVVKQEGGKLHNPSPPTDIKKIADAFTAGYHYGMDQSNVLEPDGQVFPDKQAYLKSLTK